MSAIGPGEAGMVERVARALCWQTSIGSMFEERPPEAMRPYVDRNWLIHEPAARVAIEAMREPTAAMVDSGVAFALCVNLGDDYRWSDYVADQHRAMIDAALTHPRPTPNINGTTAPPEAG